MTLRHDDGRKMTLQQVMDEAWQEFGAAALLDYIGSRVAWNAAWEAPRFNDDLRKAGADIIKLAEQIRRMEQVAAADGGDVPETAAAGAPARG